MSRHEQLRRIGIEHGAHGVVIIAGIATNMLDEHINILALETVLFTIHQPEVATVTVATYSPERTEGSKFLRYLDTTDIAGMPDFIAGFKVMQILIIPVRVGIA